MYFYRRCIMKSEKPLQNCRLQRLFYHSGAYLHFLKIAGTMYSLGNGHSRAALVFSGKKLQLVVDFG